MFKKIFTNQQLSHFFQIAIIINNIGLFSDVIVYRHFPNCSALKLLNENLSNLSIFMVCAIFVSESLHVFAKQHRTLVTRYTALAIPIAICISIFFIWLLTTDNNLQEQFLIFCSSSSRNNQDSTIIIILIGLVIMLMINTYQTLKMSRNTINAISVPQMLRSILRLVIQKYLLMLSFFFGIFHYEKMYEFSTQFIKETQVSIYFDLMLLKYLIPISWLCICAYYIYNQKIYVENEA